MKARIELVDIPSWIAQLKFDAGPDDPVFTVLERLYTLGRHSRKISLNFSRETSPVEIPGQPERVLSHSLSVSFDLAAPQDHASQELDLARQRVQAAMFAVGPLGQRELQDAYESLKAAQGAVSAGLERASFSTEDTSQEIAVELVGALKRLRDHALGQDGLACRDLISGESRASRASGKSPSPSCPACREDCISWVVSGEPCGSCEAQPAPVPTREQFKKMLGQPERTVELDPCSCRIVDGLLVSHDPNCPVH